jgi:hypothetical protein
MRVRLGKKPTKCQPEISVQNETISPILNLFPEYSDLFLKTQKTLMSGNGSLPFDQRHYIAMIACKVYGCEELVSLEERSFLASGGDQAWLQDPDCIPERIQRLDEINNLLGETPWLVKSGHIKALTEYRGSWAVSEIVHALAIISNYHALSSFILGTGHSCKHTKSFFKIHNKKCNGEKSDTFSFHSMESNQDFSWDEQGFSVMSAFYSDMAYLIDDRMRAGKYLSFLAGFEEEKNVKFNESIWYEVQAHNGIHHDDIDKEEMQEVLDEKLKLFINICSQGHSTSPNLLSNLRTELGYSLRVFVSIIVMEAKLQSELNYALKAVNKYMTQG